MKRFYLNNFLTVILLFYLLLPAEGHNNLQLLTKPNLKVLDLGNSYTSDVTVNLPSLVNSLNADVSDMCLYKVVLSNSRFTDWYDLINGEYSRPNIQYKIEKVTGGLTVDTEIGEYDCEDNSAFLHLLTSNEWDLIIIHQQSAFAPYYDSWSGEGIGGKLNELMSTLRELQPQASFGTYLVHSYSDDYTNNTEGSSYLRWQLIANSVKKMTENYEIDFVMPYGTAIENLRQSSLNNEMDLTRDGIHLALGLSRYTAACCYYEALLAPRTQVSMMANKYRLSFEETSTTFIPVTDENAPIAQRAARLAIEDWYNCVNPEDSIDVADKFVAFKDSIVRTICLSNWDNDGDGLLSENEAAAVTDLGSVFSENTSITSFDELAYFKGLTKIDDEAFTGCTLLTSVVVPENVRQIGKKAFYACYQLRNIILPEGLEEIDDNGIAACTNLTEIELPSTLTTINNRAFYFDKRLTSISLPASITSIGAYAFHTCHALMDVTVNMQTPISIAPVVFDDNTYSNATLHVPNGKILFYKNTGCWSSFLNVVDLDGNTEQDIADYILFADSQVRNICLANWDTNGDLGLDKFEAAAVTNLGSVFSGNTSITSFDELAYFTGLTKIDDDAFNGCTFLTSVVVPENVKQIGKKAFYTCYKLTNIVLPEGLELIDENGFAACKNLASVELPSTLRSINNYGFYYNTKLASVTLPASITSIGDYAFSQCNALMDITADMEYPCTISSTVFTTDVFNNALLHVTYDSYEIYRNTNCWSRFINIIMEPVCAEISAAPISIVSGESGILNLSLISNIPIVSFQFDVALESGLSLTNASVIPTSDFVLSTAEISSGIWRILAYSPNNKPIAAQNGDLVALEINTEEMMTPGAKNVSFTDFSMSFVGRDDEVQSFSSENINATINIVAATVTDAGKGDVNLDGIVNVQDIVVLINHIFGSTPRKFGSFNADANSDGTINVADVSAIVILCMPGNTTNPAPTHVQATNLAAVTWDTSDGLSLTIGDAHNYVATQMEIITEGTLRLNGITTEGSHAAAWQQIGDNRYRVLVFSNANDTFSAFGPHLFFDMEGDGNVTLNDVLLVDAEGEGYMAEPSSTGYTTGITTLNTDLSAPADVYSVSGQIVRQHTTSLKNLPAGIYIVNGKKMVLK